MTAEHDRQHDDYAAWTRWGPYLSERAWGTVREDYSADGDAWGYLPHDHARSRAYRWNEDGLAGLSDDKGRVCFALALWNGQDPILKERLFGLSGPEGNHGEDVKEYYAYLDSTPTHSAMETLYRYSHAAYPYERLVAEARQRGKDDGEFELIDTGIFAENRFCDIFVAYAKASPDDILIRIRAINRGPEPAELCLLPTLWYRNTWSWQPGRERGDLAATSVRGADGVAIPTIVGVHPIIGDQALLCEGADELLFTENDTNLQRLYGAENLSPFVKDAFHRYVVEDERAAINPAQTGTKAAALYRRRIAPGEAVTLRLRLVVTPGRATIGDHPASALDMVDAALLSGDWPTIAARLGGVLPTDPFADFDATFATRQREADAFYAALLPNVAGTDSCLIYRQALAGMLWSKQFYHYVVARWLDGDPSQPPPPPGRRYGRNHEWRQLYNERVMSMPDAWEYPWFAAWDLAFHCIPLAIVDPAFAKGQLDLLLREWYQHPNGQVPAYEWAFDDVNPPVLAWAAWRVYQIERAHHDHTDRAFLERVFHKLLINFTWWVNRKDAEGHNVFQGGFLGLDNIGVFDRSKPLPTGGYLEQSDGTSWMAMFCLNMLTIALELARENPVYEAIATKFFEHFLSIAAAMAAMGDQTGADGIALWNDEDEFFYDILRTPDGQAIPLRIRSFVGLIPLFAVETIEPEVLDALPEFRRALEWYLDNRPELARLVSRWHEPGLGARRLLAICRGHRLKRLLKRILDPEEFLSLHGIRALSRYHAEHPYTLNYGGEEHVVSYEPAESRSGMFGGNSNWRGPIWFPVNYLLIESLQRFHHYFGDEFVVECPTGSGVYMTLDGVANELSRRLIGLFALDERGQRAVFGADERFQADPLWRDYPPFSEYFHGDTGMGLGASHQTGWTGLVAKLIQQQYHHQYGGHDVVKGGHGTGDE